MEVDIKKLLRNKKVIEEITRHKWLQSEMAGYDVGIEAATQDWIERYAEAWVTYHMPGSTLAKPSTKKSRKSKDK